MKHHLVIKRKPKAKGRPRAGKYGMYTDKGTREYEQLIKDAYIASKGPLFDGPVTLIAVFSKDSISITINEAEDTSSLRGDVDNYVKSITDGLNGVAYLDDGQVMNIKGHKR